MTIEEMTNNKPTYAVQVVTEICREGHNLEMQVRSEIQTDDIVLAYCTYLKCLADYNFDDIAIMLDEWDDHNFDDEDCMPNLCVMYPNSQCVQYSLHSKSDTTSGRNKPLIDAIEEAKEILARISPDLNKAMQYVFFADRLTA